MDSFWDFFWFIISFFLLMAYLAVLFQILTDLFRDRDTNGWVKAIWVFFLILVPLFASLVYLILRGHSMASRNVAATKSAQSDAESYIRSVSAGAASPADEIKRAKDLLDAGVIDEHEFNALKAKAVG